MDVSHAAALYASGLTLRQVAEVEGVRHPFTIQRAFVRQGISRRRWDPRTGGPQYRPRIETVCAMCGQAVMVRAYYFRNGSGTNAAPRPGANFCNWVCRLMARRLAKGGMLFHFLFPPTEEQIAAAAAACRRDSASVAVKSPASSFTNSVSKSTKP